MPQYQGQLTNSKIHVVQAPKSGAFFWDKVVCENCADRLKVTDINLQLTFRLENQEEITGVKAYWGGKDGISIMTNGGSLDMCEDFLKKVIPLVYESIEKAKRGERSSNLYVTPSTKLQ